MKGRKQGFENFIQRPCVRRTKIWREKLSLTKMLQCMHNIQSTHYCILHQLKFFNISTPSLSFLFISFHRSQADNFHYKLLLVIFFDFDSVYRGAGFFFP